jgi:prolyl oligopeptidase
MSNNSKDQIHTHDSSDSSSYDHDPYLWLEDIESKKSMKWIENHNEKSLSTLEKYPEYQKLYDKILEILQSKDKLPYVTIRGKYVYNFWQDAEHIRGIIRRTTIEDYRNQYPSWDVLLDIDKLSESEKENWVYKGSSYIYPNYDRVIFSLSRGGSDACFLREFDVTKRQFVENGFNLNEAKSDITWIDYDHVFVSTDFGPGSLNKSGYPRFIKLWSRNQSHNQSHDQCDITDEGMKIKTNLEEAKTVFESSVDDVDVNVMIFYEGLKIKYTIFARSIDFFNKEFFLFDPTNYTHTKLDLPQKCNLLGLYNGQFIISLQEQWRDIKTGSLCSFILDDYVLNPSRTNINQLFVPSPKVSYESFDILKHSVMITTMNNVVNEITEYAFVNDQWIKTGFNIPSQGSLSMTSDEFSDIFYVCAADFLTPSSLFEYHINGYKYRYTCNLVKKLPNLFDSSKLKVLQKEAKSKDGTMIPYFIISKKDLLLDGSNPTLMYGYGGFEVSELPYYSGVIGNAWLNYGGVYVVANIRGGGEFGPEWHQVALKKNRMKCYEDFICIAEDLIKSGVTSPKKLGIKGGSNGGLLVGAVTMLRPELFNGVICSVPLLDMKRYHLLLAGNSWIGEYGDPDDAEMWNVIKKYSPYHNIKPDQKYPVIFFTTSTKDDRVHPGHARKMVAKLESMNYEVLYYENIEGGHGGAANQVQTAKLLALEYSYMLARLFDQSKITPQSHEDTCVKTKKKLKRKTINTNANKNINTDKNNKNDKRVRVTSSGGNFQ